jgi:hypothetical protein
MLRDCFGILKHQRKRERELERVPGESEGCSEWFWRCLGSSRNE